MADPGSLSGNAGGKLAVVSVPARVRDLSGSRHAAVERLGGAAQISLALDRRLPLEFKLSRW